MTAIRQEAIQMLERVPEDKLSFVIQIMQGVNGLIEATEKRKKKVKDLDQNIPVYKDITFNATKNTNIFAILNSLDNLLVIKDYSFIKAYKLSENEIAYTIRFTVANNNYQNLTKQEIDETIKAVVDIIIANKAEIKGI